MFLRRKKEKEPKEISESLEFLRKRIRELEEDISQMKKESEDITQRIGLVRFNPFPGIGGDQSFSLALLNKKNDGIIITSFYTREGCSVYGKPVKGGESDYNLSEEERRAIEVASQKSRFFERKPDKKMKNEKRKK